MKKILILTTLLTIHSISFSSFFENMTKIDIGLGVWFFLVGPCAIASNAITQIGVNISESRSRSVEREYGSLHKYNVYMFKEMTALSIASILPMALWKLYDRFS